MSERIPMVSVIIPTCNRAEFIERAINSVLAQTFTDYEIIVVDDCSDDNTADVINQLNISNLSYFRHNARMGGAAARNTGIAVAHGKFIAFLDDDDEWLPEKIRLQVEVLDDNQNIGMVYTGYHYVVNSSKKIVRTFRPKNRGYIYNELLSTNCVGTTSTAIIRKECFYNVGYFDCDLPASQDWDMWIRISKLFEIDYIEIPLINFYMHDNRITRNTAAKISGKQILLKKHFNAIKYDSKALSLHYFFIGYLFCHNGELSNGRKNILKAIMIYPYNYQYYKYFSFSLVGSLLYKKLIEFKSSFNKLSEKMSR